MDENVNQTQQTETPPPQAPQQPAPAPQPAAQTSLGLDEKIEAMLCYLLTIVGGLIFFFAEKKSKYVKFHAMQSIIFSGIFIVIEIIIGIISGVLAAAWAWGAVVALSGINTLICLAFAAVSIIGIIFTLQMKTFKMPIIGAYAEKIAEK